MFSIEILPNCFGLYWPMVPAPTITAPNFLAQIGEQRNKLLWSCGFSRTNLSWKCPCRNLFDEVSLLNGAILDIPDENFHSKSTEEKWNSIFKAEGAMNRYQNLYRIVSAVFSVFRFKIFTNGEIIKNIGNDLECFHWANFFIGECSVDKRTKSFWYWFCQTVAFCNG